METIHGKGVMKKASMKPKPRPTYHDGANDERTAILARVRRDIRRIDKDFGLAIQRFLLGRASRAKKKPGGL